MEGRAACPRETLLYGDLGYDDERDFGLATEVSARALGGEGWES